MDSRPLIEILAKTDAIFVPFRDLDGDDWRCNPNSWLARQAYPREGIKLPSAAHTPTARQQQRRGLAQLATAGMVRRYKSSIYNSGVALTAAGEARARALCGLPGIAVSFELMQHIETLSKQPPALLTDYWIAERDLDAAASPTPTPPADRGVVFAALEDCLLPAMTRGWVRSAADALRNVRYAITDKGRKALLTEPPARPDVQESEKLYRLYRRHLRAALRELASRDPGPEIGDCGLPVSIYNVPFSGVLE